MRLRNPAHSIALGLVWLAIFLSAFVMIEPAPADAMSLGIIILLPLIGLAAYPPALTAGLAVWLVIGAFGLFSAVFSRDVGASTVHTLVSIYLYVACFSIATFIAKHPIRHVRLILNAYQAACLVAATVGIVGYLDLVPGAYEILTRYDRATGLFKDPNVFGPFLICGLLMSLHQWLVRSTAKGILPLLGAVVIMGAILLSFSRGAWAATIFAMLLYSYFYMLTAERNTQRLKLAGLVLLAGALATLVIAAALQSDSVAQLLADRATLSQPYDQGSEGRFGGQAKAIDLLIGHPLGIGAQIFGSYYHHEEAHNVYLSMLLNAGWIGGFLYLIVCVTTLALGFAHALKRTKTQALFQIAFAALAANIFEGLIIDSDHWRHFYLLLGIVWGLLSSDRRIIRNARIVSDRRPTLLRRVLIVPPSRRGVRLVARIPQRLPVPVPARRRPQGRAGRIVAR